MKKKFWILVCILIILILISSCVGRYELSVFDIYNILIDRHSSQMDINLFYNIRLSRTFLVVICGGALALSGTAYQSVFKNPLVSPDILGVANGCSIGAIISIVYISNSVASMQLITFLFGMCAVLAAIYISKLMYGNKILSMIISGIIINSLASSIIMTLKYVADPTQQLSSIEFWLMGGFNKGSWDNISQILPAVLTSILILYLLRWKLKILTLGDEEAQTLGINVNKIRFIILSCSTALVAAVVSVAGIVSWIGLIAPHIVRMYVGDDIIVTFFHSFVIGSIILLFSDILSRTLFAAELPISILTSFVGSIFLFYLLFKKRGDAS